MHVGGILILKCVYPGIIHSFRFKINGNTANYNTLQSKYGSTCCSKEQNSTHWVYTVRVTNIQASLNGTSYRCFVYEPDHEFIGSNTVIVTISAGMYVCTCI